MSSSFSNRGASQHSCSVDDLERPGICMALMCVHERCSVCSFLFERLLTLIVSLLPPFCPQWDFTGLNGSLWVLAWTLFSFALLCGILRSQVDQKAAVFTPVFAVRTALKCNAVRGRLLLSSGCTGADPCWADYKEESMNSDTSQELISRLMHPNCSTASALSSTCTGRSIFHWL